MRGIFQRELSRRLSDRVRFAEPLSRHTTWGIGGPVEAYCQAHNIAEVTWLLIQAREEGLPVLWLGRGSNLLVNDQGLPGLAVTLGGDLALLRQEGHQLHLGAGISVAQSLNFCRQAGLSGLEWAAGLPASWGGAVAMNAGAYGREVKDVLSYVTLLSEQGILDKISASELSAAYRHGGLGQGVLALEVGLSLSPLEPAQVEEKMRYVLSRRRATQPLSQRTAGCVFKNPLGKSAGQLIERAGLKGLKVNEAQVSRLHANFIENQGSAQAADVLALIDQIIVRVREISGITLELEVKKIGYV